MKEFIYDLADLPEDETLDSILQYYKETGKVKIMKDGEKVEIEWTKHEE